MPTLRLLRAAADLLFPRSCVGCREPVEEASPLRHLCGRCATGVTKVTAPHCRICGYPFFGEATENRACEHCAELEPVFGQGRTCVLLRGAARAFVHELKYRGGLYLLEDVRALFATMPGLSAYLENSHLVPVPLHRRKERERGYNQARLIAEQLVALVPSARLAPRLRRTEDSLSQTRRTRRERAAHLKNAFALAGPGRLDSQLRYVLVDDVFTTGSTLNACAAVLRRAGARAIDVLTLGHG